MQTAILQNASLVMTGNAVVQGWDAGQWWPSAQIFTFCERVEFGTESGGLFQRKRMVAADPLAFITQVKAADGAFRLRLEPLSDHEHIGAYWLARAEGGRWLIEVVNQDKTELWEAVWTFHERWRDHGAWRVTYERVARGDPLPPPDPIDLTALHGHLRDTLIGIASFAREQKFDNFATIFESGLAKLKAPADTPPRLLAELAPPGFLTSEAMHMMDVALTSWVFGGMGSWSDMGEFGDPAVDSDFQHWTSRLLADLQRAVLFAASSTWRPGSA